MADLKEKQRVAPDAKSVARLPDRLWQSLCVGGEVGRAAARPQQPAEAAAWALRRADLRHRVYGAARGEPPHLDLSHAALGRASALRAHRQRAAFAARRSTTWKRRPRNCAGARSRFPTEPTDFVEGIITIGGNGDAAQQIGMAAHIYAANRSMTDRYFYNADGEMLLVPQQGRVRLVTELGLLDVARGRDRGRAARHAFQGRAAGRPVARLYLRELRPAVSAARAGPARRQRPCQRARFRGAGRGV